MASTKPSFEVLQASIDSHEESEFRIRVGRHVKYLTIDGGIYKSNTMAFVPTLLAALPPFPTGDWNMAHVSLSSTDKNPICSGKKVKFPGVTHTWRPCRIEYLDLNIGKQLRTNVYEATHASFKHTVIAKFARFDWEIPQLDAETRANKWINGHDIGPQFLGHITEGGRVIGILTERIKDFRHAGPEDLKVCRAALDRLHKLGIKHGDINRYNFLIRQGEAILVDFDCSTKCSRKSELDAEANDSVQESNDTSGRGGSGSDSECE